MSETSQKEIARIHHSDNQDLVATIVDNVGLDLRVFIKKDSYSGSYQKETRIYLFDGIWEEFKKLVRKVSRSSKNLE